METNKVPYDYKCQLDRLEASLSSLIAAKAQVEGAAYYEERHHHDTTEYDAIVEQIDTSIKAVMGFIGAVTPLADMQDRE